VFAGCSGPQTQPKPETITANTNNTPPSGTWLWTNSAPSYQGCPVDMSSSPPPADPPLEVSIELNEDGEHLLISNDYGAINLYRITLSKNASAYQGRVEIPVTDGDDLVVEYDLEYNDSDDATIRGQITSHLPEPEGCQANRDFSAVYIGR
ncbi:MAG: hypothetical protein ABFS17_11335, partial [Chloroflexota bacterium]